MRSPKSMSPNTFGWMHGRPKAVAALTPVHFGVGCGAFQRLGPIGGAAYGMPRYWRTPATAESAPLTRPASVLTGDWAVATRGSVNATSATAAVAIRAPRASVQAMRISSYGRVE